MGLSNIVENISMALTSLKSNKMRSLLTMLGIIIGIAAVIAIETVGGSMSGTVTESMSGMGISNITVSLTQKSSNDGTSSDGVMLRWFMDSTPADEDLITDQMIQEYLAAFPDQVDHMELSVQAGTGTIDKYGDPETTISATVQGINHDALAATGDDAPLLAGRWLNDDTDAGRKLCVVSQKFVEQAVGGTPTDAIGKRITLTINSMPQDFYIVGVYKYVEDAYSSLMGQTSDDTIVTNFYIPLDVAKRIAGEADGYQSITAVAANGVDVNSFVDTTGNYFASYYTRNDTWTVKASSISSLVDSLTKMLGTISLGISAIAAISLLVGGIGVMNIMTVSVTERTREIGIRKALGAREGAILLQFVMEAATTSALGGVMGIILGYGLSAAANQVLPMIMETNATVTPTFESVIVAFGISVGIGIFFGFLPARRAARLNPIEALRYD